MRYIVTLAVVALVACSGRPPRRPEGLPAAAVWVGKGEQGRFVEIGGREGIIWSITVFDAKGGRHPAARWRLQGFARASLEPEEIVGFREEALVLTDGSRLVPAP